MEKKYLVITKYESISDGITECSENSLKGYFANIDKGREYYIFEYDFDKIKSVLTEVELKILPKQNEEI